MRQFHDAPLADLTTMHVGGPARRLAVAESADEIVDIARETDDAGEPLLVLSGGSNVVIADTGFPGTVLRIASTGIEVESQSQEQVLVRVAAGEIWDEFVATAVAQGWSGIECLSGIPGLVGATPVQNVGAYGQEVAQTIAGVRVYDRREQTVREFSTAECEFTYRHSVFKETGRYVVLDVSYRLATSPDSAPIAYADLAAGLGVEQGQRVPLEQARAGVLAQRAKRGMVLADGDHDTWSCGSFFTNPQLSERAFARLLDRVHDALGPDVDPPRFPGAGGTVKTSAAWLIDRAGFGKGYRMPGPAALSTKHTLALTNRGSASAADVAQLAREIRDGVQERFGVVLVNEPVFVGHDL
ncbi:UDP-N-acetylmuramate dehydrogenase [Dermacoccaceae bacterium W4C1]